MPRNLEEERRLLPMLVSESELGKFISRQSPFDAAIGINEAQMEEIAAVKDLHPYAQILSLGDLESCLKLEEATFPENQRCSREKFNYRFTKCSELCLGLFTPAVPGDESQDAATASTAKSPDSAEPERKGILLAHIIATKTTNDVIKDGDMEVPSGWREGRSSDDEIGHREHGRTIGLHSLAVLPEYQRRGLGKILMKAYIQRMVEAGNADRIALLTYDKLVPYYENKFGFKNMGKSSATFAGEEWNDMVLEFKDCEMEDSLVEEEG